MLPLKTKQKSNSNARPTKNQKVDKSARSKSAKQPASPVPTNESTKTCDAAPSTATDENSAPISSNDTQKELFLLLANQFHHQFVKDNFLSELRELRNVTSTSNHQKNLRTAIVSLQTKTVIAEKDFADAPLVCKSYQTLVEDVEEMIRKCDDVEYDLLHDYTTVLHILGDSARSIGEKHDQIEAAMDATINQHKLFDQNTHQNAEKLDKARTEKDFITMARDNGCEQIIQSNKMLSEMSKATLNVRKTNGLTKQEIDGMKQKLDEEEEVKATITKNANIWLKEKTIVVDKIIQDKAQLLKDLDDAKQSTNKGKIESENLCDKESKLTNEIADQETLTARMKTTNKNLRDDQTSQSEFETKKSILQSDIKKMTDDVVFNAGLADKKQILLEGLIRVMHTIAMKQQKREEFNSNLNELDRETWKQEHKLSIMLDYIKDVKTDISSFSSKRVRYSESVTSTDTLEKNINDGAIDSSSFGLNDM